MVSHFDVFYWPWQDCKNIAFVLIDKICSRTFLSHFDQLSKLDFIWQKSLSKGKNRGGYFLTSLYEENFKTKHEKSRLFFPVSVRKHLFLMKCLVLDGRHFLGGNSEYCQGHRTVIACDYDAIKLSKEPNTFGLGENKTLSSLQHTHPHTQPHLFHTQTDHFVLKVRKWNEHPDLRWCGHCF